jgi:hypothetical protein
MERLHNGSSEEGWPKESSEEILAEEKRREKGRSQENSKKEGDQKAPLALAVNDKKAGHVPAFLLIGTFPHPISVSANNARSPARQSC